MIRVRMADGSIAYRNDPYILDLLPGNKIFDKVEPSVVFFHRKPKNGTSFETQRTGRQSRHRQQELIITTPTMPPAGQATLHFANVKVKFGIITLLAPFRISPGDAVIVEAEGGGEHLAVVESVTTVQPRLLPMFKIIRRAQPFDLRAAAECRRTEVFTRNVCQGWITRAGLHSIVTDVEWQLDRQAVSILLASESSHDLAEVYQVLQPQFQCRVWLLPTKRVGEPSGMSSTTPSLSASDSAECLLAQADIGL